MAHSIRSFHRRLPWVLCVLAGLAVVATLLFFGIPQFREKIAIARPITFVGHSDDAAYAEMARSLVEGRGLEVRYISFYFIPYGQEITRREDQWPPFMAFAIAPCFYLWGQAAWVAKLPAMFFGSIGLPLAAALLTYALCRRGYAAIVAGLLMMAHPYIYNQSLRTLSDVATGMLICTFAACVLLGRRWRWMHVVAGFVLAAAYYAKGSELILLVLYPVVALLACGWRAFRGPWMYAGAAIAVGLMAPFWISNYRLFGNPFHSTQNYVSGYYSFADWEDATYFPYWGHNPPKTSDRWTQHSGTYARHSREQLETLANTALTGIDPPPDAWGDFGRYGFLARDLLNGDFFRQPHPWEHLSTARVRPIGEWQMPPWELAGASAVVFVLWMMVAGVMSKLWELGRWLYRRRRPEVYGPPVAPREPSWRAGPVAGVALILVVQALFLAYFWAIRTRFSFNLMPLIAAMGCAGGAYFLERPLILLADGVRLVLRRRWALRGVCACFPAVVTIVFAAGLVAYAAPLRAAYADWLDGAMDRSEYPFQDETLYVALGKWLGAHAPGAVVMARNPWEITFYNRMGKGVTYPFPTVNGPKGAAQLFAIARYYRVTHVFLDSGNGVLQPYLTGRVAGLKRVRGAPGPLYEIEWGKIPVKTVEEALGAASAPR